MYPTRPTGGVRNVIPGKGNYLSADGPTREADPARKAETRADAGPFDMDEPGPERNVLLEHARHGRLVRGDTDPLLPRLLADLQETKHADLAVAFIQRSGVELVYEHLNERLEKGGRIRLLTGDYMDITDPDALTHLIDLDGNLDLRVFLSQQRTFHPKSYIFYDEGGWGFAYVGSSNLTRPALGEGIEWNLRVDSATQPGAFGEIRRAFEELFRHPSTRVVDQEWIESYRRRRRADRPVPTVEVAVEPPAEVPTPHGIQVEALAALERTREEGNQAGLVVLATGLGKTWLSAFDSARPEFRRVLFVAHREEILGQARRTFRRIRPHARLGNYTGAEKAGDGDVLFASVQTLSRTSRLEIFEPDRFDYIVVDEFHHAAAKTYRRIIDYFLPRFLLGLTATPERTDGGDLLTLCGENLVYRCDFVEGIRRDLLCPFDYYGVPDDVDYANIPWRSARFDERALTEAVATRARARNALQQHRERGGSRTLAFCCSQRHAEFMAEFFEEAGVRAVAVHSGPGSAPRTMSLEQLENGDLDVVFAVDLFNEGVDLPRIDTVLMLRPTESAILWTQQLGRGLRKAEGKDRLTVIDYIGNHRVFLVKIRAMLEPLLREQLRGDEQIRYALERVSAGDVELPPGCGVTYELEAIDIIGKVLRRPKGAAAVEAAYRDFRDRAGRRPAAAELYHQGYSPKALGSAYGSWFGFVERMEDLSAEEREVLGRCGDFLGHLDTTAMTRSYKMLLLLAMLNLDRMPGEIPIAELTREFRRLAERSAKLRRDVGPAIEDDDKLAGHVERNPIAAWTGGRGTGGRPYFSYENGIFRTEFAADPEPREAFQEMVRELADWRLAEYLDRGGPDIGAGEFVGKVKHAGGRPMIFLPDRKQHPGIPFGRTDLIVGEKTYEASFVKIALNVVTEPGSGANVLPDLLRGWFGPDAGLPGTAHTVIFTETDDGWRMTPGGAFPARRLELWKSYSREEIPALFGEEFNPGKWNSGFVTVGYDVFLLVSLEKGDMIEDHRYSDHFERSDTFIWQSQRRTRQDSKHGRLLSTHRESGHSVHLFVRKTRKLGTRGAPFIYCGDVNFDSWEGEQPITVTWRLNEPVPDRLKPDLLLG